MRALTLIGCSVFALLSDQLAAADRSSTLPPPADQQLARELFREMIETRTTHDVGSTALAEAIKAHLISGGFSAQDVVFIAPEDHPQKGNVIVRYRGRGKAKPVLFLAHLDVVEAKSEDWTVEPFKLTEKDGFFYGRGTIDMKQGATGLLESLLRLKREGFVPERDIIAAFTADEEAGGDANGPAFLLKQHRELIDAALAVNLDIGGGNYKDGKRLYYEIGTAEKTYLTFTIETTSPGGHGSLPGPDNAIYRIAKVLSRLEAYKFPVMLTDTTRASFEHLATFDPGPESADMKAVAKNPPDQAAAERLSEIVRLNAQLRTTCVATLVSGGHAENALPQRARAKIQCRMMPGDTAEHVQAQLVNTFAEPSVTVALDAQPIVSPESAPTPQIMNKATAVVHSMWPGVTLVPVMSTGFSDSRQTRNAGIPTYGLGGTWSDIDENRAHGRDERIGVQAFDESVEYIFRLVREMSKAK
ncbi:MAG: M20/M25/M40 family metallo-hydrolase [Povalibacter sp.]